MSFSSTSKSLQSRTAETKEKLEAFLQSAIIGKSQQSQSSENLLEPEVRKAPVPLPRKKLAQKQQEKDVSEASSCKTYSVVKETIKDVQQEKNPFVLKPQELEDDGPRTYSVQSQPPEELVELKEIVQQQEKEVKEYNYNKILEVVLHKTDRLLMNSFVTHPVVKLNVINGKTGQYLEKSDKTRPVVFYFENEESDYILPVMSRAFNLQEKRSFCPCWEEKILLNEDFQHFLKEDVVMFFEVLDFPSGALIQQPNLDKICYKGWHWIAFAFLKPLAPDGSSNLNRRLRLQLYHPGRSPAGKCPVWTWWFQKKLKKYPASLYVTIRETESLVKQENVNLERSSRNPVEEKTNTKITIEKLDLSRFKKDNPVLPESCQGKLESYDAGCFLCKFSHNGLFLAVVVQISEIFFVVVYSVETWEEVRRFSCHQEMIYSLVWSRNDDLIITGSADNTIAIWNFSLHCFVQILPHPCYVYALDFSPDNTVASGGFDGVIRIWTQQENNFNLSEELEAHNGFITCIIFNETCSKLFSSDSVGVVRVWDKISDSWKVKDVICLPDLKGVTINQIILFKNQRKLLIHSRDSTLRIVSLKNSFCTMHWLQGALNSKVQTSCSISPCGTFVLAGGENGLLVAWNAKTGRQVHTFDLFALGPVHCVEFHPFYNLFVATHFGQKQPILVFGNKVTLNLTTKINCLNDKKEEKGVNFHEILHKMDQILQ